MLGHGNQPVVALRLLSFFRLFRLNATDQTAFHETTGEDGFIEQHQDIQGIAIVALR